MTATLVVPKSSAKKDILKILSDNQWHTPWDLLEASVSYRDIIYKLRQEGCRIESRKSPGGRSLEYRLLGIAIPRERVFSKPKKRKNQDQNIVLFLLGITVILLLLNLTIPFFHVR